MGYNKLRRLDESPRKDGYTEADLLQAQFRTAILLIGVLFIGRQCVRFGDGIVRGYTALQESKKPGVTSPVEPSPSEATPEKP